MAVAAGVLNDTRRRTLEAICDTVAPSIEVDERRLGPPRLLRARRRRPRDCGAARGAAGQSMMPEEIEGARPAARRDRPTDGFANSRSRCARDPARGRGAQVPRRSSGVRQLRALTLLFFYALPDGDGRTRTGRRSAIPGPISAPPSPEEAPKTIAVEHLAGASATLEADVCVVGSGAGGGVIAAELAARAAPRSWCSRWASTATSPTSSSSSCPACSSSIWAAAWPPARTARSRSSPARRSGAARSSTT